MALMPMKADDIVEVFFLPAHEVVARVLGLGVLQDLPDEIVLRGRGERLFLRSLALRLWAVHPERAVICT